MIKVHGIITYHYGGSKIYVEFKSGEYDYPYI